jgi:DNA repair exonuclease SbcCD ATPase subunit
MKMQFKSSYWLFCTVIALVSAITLAWAGNPQDIPIRKVQVRDTVPSGKDQNAQRRGDKDLDKELRNLEEAGKKLREISNKDWEKIHRDIEEAIKKIDIEKISLNLENELRKVDMEKIAKEMEEALDKINFKKIEKDIEAAIKESKIDVEKMKQELQQAGKEIEEQLEKKAWRKEIEELKKIDVDKIKVEMENAKNELSHARDHLKLEKLNLRENMENARVEIDKASEELKGYQAMIYSMEQDALLSTKGNYKIEYKHGELSINGKKQSAEVTNKYKKYFKKDAMTVQKQDGESIINTD